MVGAALVAAGERFKRARDEFDAAEAALYPLLVEAVRQDVPRAELVELTGLTRQAIARIEKRERGVRA